LKPITVGDCTVFWWRKLPYLLFHWQTWSLWEIWNYYTSMSMRPPMLNKTNVLEVHWGTMWGVKFVEQLRQAWLYSWSNDKSMAVALRWESTFTDDCTCQTMWL